MDISEHYEVEFTQECTNEIKKIYKYIRDVLCNEIAAKRLMKKLEEYVSDLSYSPRLYVEIEKYKGTKKVYRRMVVNKYVVLYNIDEEKKKVFIAHMFYGGSDYINKI